MCPWDLSLSGGDEWRPIDFASGPERGGLDAASLLQRVSAFPRLLDRTSRKQQQQEADGLERAAAAEANARAVAGAQVQAEEAMARAGHLTVVQAAEAGATRKVPSEAGRAGDGGGDGDTGASKPAATWVRGGQGGRVVLLSKTPRWRVELERERGGAAVGGEAISQWPAATDAERTVMRRACEVHEAAVEQLEARARPPPPPALCTLRTLVLSPSRGVHPARSGCAAR